jgi:hypothetical protein
MNISGTLGGIGIKKLNLFLILLIWALLTVNTAASNPEGTIIKKGILTYPAGSYHEKEPMSLYFNTHGNQNEEDTLKYSYSDIQPEEESLSPYDSKDKEDNLKENSIENLKTLLLENKITLKIKELF